MIKFEFLKYMDKFIDKKVIDLGMREKNKYIERLSNEELSGWYKDSISNETVDDIISYSNLLRKNSKYLLVIATGGSYMGSNAIKELMEYNKFEHDVLYLGNSLSVTKISNILDTIKNEDFSLNIISKSGNTLEIKIIYDLVKKIMENKYSSDQLKTRIVITTEKKDSFFYREAINNDYKLFEFPKNIGGRYSLITVAHLLPLSFLNLDIKELVDGFYHGRKFIDDAYYYALIRNQLYKRGKYIENFSIYEEKLYYYTEWIKQLFAESEGKDKKGILPISTVNTRDLHSLGQFLQEGNPIIFETVVDININKDIVSNNISIKELNDKVKESVMISHYNEDTPSILLNVNYDLYSIGELSMFLMLSIVFSSYLFNVNPFNQPGVEKYKNELNQNLLK